MNKTIITSITAFTFLFSYGLRADVMPKSDSVKGAPFPPGPNDPEPEEGEESVISNAPNKVAVADDFPEEAPPLGVISAPRASKDVIPGQDLEGTVVVEPGTIDESGEDFSGIDAPEPAEQDTADNELYVADTEEKEVSKGDETNTRCRRPIFWSNIALAAAAVIVAVVAIVLVSQNQGRNK